MGTDVWIVIRWWGILFLVGAVAFPLTKKLFSSWIDKGYMFTKAVGIALVVYLVYLAGIFHVAPFTIWTVGAAMGVVFLGGMVPLSFRPASRNPLVEKNDGSRVKPGMTMLLVEEIFFFMSLLFWSWVKGHEPTIHGLEKFMDYGFMKSILNSQYFPAPDMWFSGLPINYYYFGHTVVAVLTKFSGIDLSYAFNLMLSTIFALTLTMSFSIGVQLLWVGHGGKIGRIGQIAGGLLTAFLVTLAGNMQTIYAFTKGYTEDKVVPFWTLLWKFSEVGNIGEGLERYWYANATRFIPFTIHEFPSYSFVVSDVHGHVLSIPFVLLAIGLLIEMFKARGLDNTDRAMSLEGFRAFEEDAAISIKNRLLRRMNGLAITKLTFYGFLCGILLMTNALDGPIYLGLFLVLFLFSHWTMLTRWEQWKPYGVTMAIVLTAAALTSLPFLFYFKSFVSGIAINCPPAFLADRKIGMFLFESVQKCQHSPLWMMALLWGFFVYCGVCFIGSKIHREGKRWHILNRDHSPLDMVLMVFFCFSLLLIIFPEFFYFKDIYPAHFRSNTMFKLGYQAFILFSIVSGYTIMQVLATRKQLKHRVFLLLVIPQLFLVSIFPLFSVRSYFDSLRTYKGLSGVQWLMDQYPDDWAGIDWINKAIEKEPLERLSGIVEADGDSYTDYARFSAFTGLPTIVGWPVHEWLWRGTYDVVAPRREEVRMVYEASDVGQVRSILEKYGVRYIIVGTLERQKFQHLREDTIAAVGSLVFNQGSTRIYRVNE